MQPVVGRVRERLANTWDEVQRLFHILDEVRHVTYDTETSGLDWRRNHVVGYVITPLGEDSCYVPVRHLGGGNLPGCSIPGSPEGWRGDLHPFEIELAKRAGAVHRHWVGHNLLFDLRMSKRHGITLYGSYEDTSINDPLIDENQRSYGLESCAERRGVQPKKGDALYQYIAETQGLNPELGKKLMEHFWKTNAENPVVWGYAAGDGVSTEELWAAQQPIICEDEEYEDTKTDGDGNTVTTVKDFSRKKVHAVECRVIKTLFRMSTGGVRIDQSELERVDKLFEEKGKTAMEGFPEGFRTNAPTDLREFLRHRIDGNWPRNEPTAAEKNKARREKRQPMGALKFDEATLKLVPEGRSILDAKKLKHARSSFTLPMIERHLMPDGRVYGDVQQLVADDYGTISGRLSMFDPNLQQVPKRDKFIAPEYRKCFVPDEGHIWWDNDYKQQEYVVFTDYTEDPKLMAGYRMDPPVDIHSTVAEMLNVERDPTAKRMNLGMLYGMGIIKLALNLGVSVAQAKAWMDQYHREFPSARKFLRSATNRHNKMGYVKTYLGRRRHFDHNSAHKAGNGIIQGSSADITKLKMVEIDEYFESEGDIFRLMLQCHDSLSWTGPEGRRDINDEAIRIMKSFGPSDQIQMLVPLGIDSGTGRNWSEAVWGRED